jgi:hypothetical protein
VKAVNHLRFLGRILPLAGLAAVLLAPASQVAAQQTAACQFILGFKTLHDLVPNESGECLENQSFTPSGDAVQHTTKGLMVWRKADNWTAFTNGYMTWINGPNGLVSRLNTDRFPWEAAAPAPVVAPGPPPPPTPTPKPIYSWYYKKVNDPPFVLCGPDKGVPCLDSAPNEGTQYVGGHVIKRDGTLASGMIVQARVGNADPTFSTTGDDGLFNILIATTCPAGPITLDVYLVDGGMKLSSYVNHVTYSNCRQAGEFHFDFVEVAP